MEGLELTVAPKEVSPQEVTGLCFVFGLLLLAAIIDGWNQYKRRNLLAR